MTSLYSLRSSTDRDAYVITKFDRDYNVESVYAVTLKECDCPRSHKTGCRHRTMLPLFIQTGHIDDGWFLDFDTRQWRKPLSEEPAFGHGPVMSVLADAKTIEVLPPEARAAANREFVTERLAKSFESESSSLPRQDPIEATPQSNAEQGTAPIAPAPLEAAVLEVEQEVSPSSTPSGPPAGAAASSFQGVRRRKVT